MSLAKVRSYFLLVVCLFIGTFPLQAAAFSISENQINQYLAEKSNIADKFGFPGFLTVDYKLQDVTAKIGQTAEKRVEINGLLKGLFQMNSDNFSADINLTFDTVPYYDAKTGEIYLKDVRILRWSGAPEKYMNQLQSVMPFLSNSVATMLNNLPVYTLDEQDPKQLMIKKIAKGIKVEQGQLELDAGLL